MLEASGTPNGCNRQGAGDPKPDCYEGKRIMEQINTAKAGGAFARPDLGPCIEWQGYRNDDGYGIAYVSRKSVGAHRAAYCQHHGITLESIKGLSVRHECDNPPCINPDHLVLGTHQDNMRDRKERGRGRSAQGEAQHLAKLTDEIVRSIRSEYVRYSKKHGSVALAKKFNVSYRAVLYALNGSTWGHVKGEQK